MYNGRDHKILSSLKRKENYLHDTVKLIDILQNEKYDVYNKI
jgi:hypothetical protein